MKEEKKTKKRKGAIRVRLIDSITAILNTLCYGLIWYMYYVPRLYKPFFRKGNWFIIFLFFLLFVAFSRIYGSYRISVSRTAELIYGHFLAENFSNFFIYLIMLLINRRLLNPLPLIGTMIIEFIISFFWCKAAHKWYFRTFDKQRTAIIWNEREDLDKLINEYGLNNYFHVEKNISVRESLSEEHFGINDYDSVFLIDLNSHDRNSIMEYCVAEGISVYLTPRFGDTMMWGSKPTHLLHLPIVRVDGYDPSPEFLFLKRFFDVILSTLGIIILSPLMIGTAIAIKAHDNGPVFYRQFRETKDGRLFELIKFRSMRVDAEKDGVARLSTGENDDRVTSVGRVIRRTRIDELPQLFNILKGDMSIVGPRPERPEISKQYAENLPEWPLRLQCKCGLTGYAQVYGKYNTTPRDKLLMDLTYISKPSIVEDMKIIFATVKILFTKESTEGVKTGQMTAESSGQNVN